MTLTRIVGDIHGKIYDYQAYSLADWNGPSIQVGDYGIGFAGDYWHESVAEWQQRIVQRARINGKFIPPEVVERMADSYVEPTLEEGFDEVRIYNIYGRLLK